MCSCAPNRPFTTHPVVDATDGPPPPAGSTVMLIEHPRSVREDYSHPADQGANQSFVWAGDKSEWRFKLAGQGTSYAGFYFLKPRNLKDRRGEYEIIFTMKPASMARYLWVGFCDDDAETPKIYVDLPLANYASVTHGKRPVEIRIPLRDFPDTGYPLTAAGLEFAMAEELEFNWSKVREIRFSSPGGRIPDHEVVITELRFAR